MSGHSKFANIKHKKEKNDAAKGKIFTKANNMPNDNIDRSIKKAAGEGSADNYEHITYEGYGPNGTAIIVKALTDNKNRTASNVRNAFTKGSGNVGTPGCVSFMFDAEVTMIPQTWVELTDEQDLKNIQKTLDLLEEDDDVQEVYHNWDE